MPLTSRRTLAGVIAVILFAPAGLRAQRPATASTDEPRRGGWIFTPSVALGGGYDDNVLLADRAQDPPRDYTSPVSPSVSLDFTGKRTTFSTGYDGSFTFYRELDELTSADHGFRALVHHRLSKRIAFFAQENFSRAPTTDALQLVGVPFYRVGTSTNTVGGGIEAALNKYTSMRAQYLLRTVDFDFDERTSRQLRGGDAHEVLVTLDRALSPRLSVGGEYSLQRGTIDQPINVEIPISHFNIQSGLGTVQFRLAPTWTVSGGIGLAHLGGALENESRTGPSLRAGTSWRAKRYTASASYQRSFVPSYGFGGTFQNQEWTGNVHVPFARNRAYVDTGVAWFINEPLIRDQPDLNSLWLSGKAGYRATPWLSVEGYYSRVEQEAQTSLGRRSRNQIGVRVVASRPFKIE